MARPWGHSASYHAWRGSTPVMDVVATVVAFASVVVGTHAGLFLMFALHHGDAETATKNALFFVGIAVANGSVDVVRHWRRHHG
jgi:hypothetical protein